MDYFEYRRGVLHVENVPVAEIAQAVGTPAYIYSERTLREHYDKLQHAFAQINPLVCYSVKSCSNLSILRLLAEMGSGFDIVSGGELYRVLKAGGSADKCFYAGAGKTDDEIRYALGEGIFMFNIESEAELENIGRIASEMGKEARCALRVNPDIDPKTHAYTSTGKKETKFGVDIERAENVLLKYRDLPGVSLSGIHLHIGSPIFETKPYVEAIGKALKLIERMKSHGIVIDTLDFGGGYAASYETGTYTQIEDYAEAIVPLLKDKGLKLVMEPGRFISANAGLLLSRVQYVKQGGQKSFVILDTGMHHLIRPPLYDSFHFIWPAEPGEEMTPPLRGVDVPLEGLQKADVVGPICETGDCLAKDRPLPPVQRGDLMAIFTAGAYGMAMASQYNSQPRPAEVLVSHENFRIIRRRESYEDLVRGEE